MEIPISSSAANIFCGRNPSQKLTMLAPSRRKVLGRALSSPAAAAAAAAATSVTLPAFLVPAFQTTASPRRQFSNTSSRPSKLGRTPISIPPTVELAISEPRVKKDVTTYLRVAKRTVTVTGPLGKLELEIPQFLTIHHDETARRAQVSIENAEITQQMEMWGMYTSPHHTTLYTTPIHNLGFCGLTLGRN